MQKNITRVNGEPLPLLPLVHANHICKKVSEDGIKVMLSGIGADELFFGYTGMINTLRVSIISKFLYPFLKNFQSHSMIDQIQFVHYRQDILKLFSLLYFFQ